MSKQVVLVTTSCKQKKNGTCFDVPPALYAVCLEKVPQWSACEPTSYQSGCASDWKGKKRDGTREKNCTGKEKKSFGGNDSWFIAVAGYSICLEFLMFKTVIPSLLWRRSCRFWKHRGSSTKCLKKAKLQSDIRLIFTKRYAIWRDIILSFDLRSDYCLFYIFVNSYIMTELPFLSFLPIQSYCFCFVRFFGLYIFCFLGDIQESYHFIHLQPTCCM